jgi:hypothetical protein
MWHRKKWIIVAVAAAAVILVVGVVGVAAFAQTTTPTAPAVVDPGKTLMGRVAAKLGIDQKTLDDAFTQAQQDMKSEAMSNRLDKLVEQGKLTQQQADDYEKWQQSRPDVPPGLDGPAKVFPRGRMGFGGFPCFPGPGGLPPVNVPGTTTN